MDKGGSSFEKNEALLDLAEEIQELQEIAAENAEFAICDADFFWEEEDYGDESDYEQVEEEAD